jgi:hypothetical protein
VPVVFEPIALDVARGERQNRIEPIKCLNRRLLYSATGHEFERQLATNRKS